LRGYQADEDEEAEELHDCSYFDTGLLNWQTAAMKLVFYRGIEGNEKWKIEQVGREMDGLNVSLRCVWLA